MARDRGKLGLWRRIVAGCLTLGLANLSWAMDDAPESSGGDARASLLPASLALEPEDPGRIEREPLDDDQIPRPRPTGPFGTQGTQWVTAGLLFADDFDTSVDVNIHVAWSQFVSRNVEFALELAAWRMMQDGDDATAINPVAVFRWHFVNRGRWSLFGDLGIGVIVSSDDVPTGGTSFNFTPRVGAGVTYQLWEEHSTRVVAGVRWHHISNARLAGDDSNPARDAPAIYAGLRWAW